MCIHIYEACFRSVTEVGRGSSSISTLLYWQHCLVFDKLYFRCPIHNSLVKIHLVEAELIHAVTQFCQALNVVGHFIFKRPKRTLYSFLVTKITIRIFKRTPIKEDILMKNYHLNQIPPRI
jgi:hypothetical protein